jgi:uncharacterized protein
MDLTTYADPTVVRLVSERFVPIRVDADRRPDISERYSLGGWPTTAFLTPDGRVLGGGTYVDAGRMPDVLERVADAFRDRDAMAVAPSQEPPVSDGSAATDADLLSVVFDAFDPEHGGFGAAPKFPLTAPIDLALQLHRETGDPAMAHIVEMSLDAMGWGPLYDAVDGGFFRCSAGRDWSDPRQEKLLDVNANLLATYLEAAALLDVARYRERAADVLRYMQTWLADPVDGGWAGSQPPDRAYYSSTADQRPHQTVPPVDRAMYSSWNALAASAVLRAAEMFGDAELGIFAVKSLERVVVACYRPGAGIAHCLGEDGKPSVRGLLEDQIAMAAAHLDTHAATGNVVYEMMAQELAHYAVRAMWDEKAGGFFDRSVPEVSERIGLMRERLKPFAANCDAARVLNRLAATTGDASFAARAKETLAAMAPLAAQQGPLAAHYILATRQPSSPTAVDPPSEINFQEK